MMKLFLFVLHLVLVYIVCAFRKQGHSFSSRITKTKERRITFSVNYSPILTDIGVTMYDAQLWFSHAVDTQFTTVTPFSLVILFFAGLITSFNPCSMGLIPLTLAYLGGSSDGDKGTRLSQAVLYAVGLAITLSLFGLSAAFLGQLYGTAANTSLSSPVISDLPALFSSALILIMGLNLLNIVNFRFPSFRVGEFGDLPAPSRALLLGASSALIASPCSSPVLASLLTVVAASHNPTLGGSLLFTYSLGYATPVVVAGAMSGSVNSWTAAVGAPWITTLLAAALVSYGTYGSLDAVSRMLSV